VNERRQINATEGFIDTATVSHAVHSLELGTSNWTTWDSQALVVATFVLLHHRMYLSASPSRSRLLSDAIKASSNLIGQSPQPEPETVQRADEYSREWLRSSGPLLSAYLGRLDSSDSFALWTARTLQDPMIRRYLPRDGYFDRTYIPEMSSVLGLDSATLTHLHEETRDATECGRLLRDSTSGAVLRRALAFGMIARGKFQEVVAGRAGLHLVAHPLRGVRISRQTNTPEVDGVMMGSAQVTFNHLQHAFIKILIGSAIQQHDRHKRVACWVANIESARARFSHSRAALPTHTDPGVAQSRAIDLAIECGFPPVPKSVLHRLDATMGLLGLALHVLQPALGLVVSGGLELSRGAGMMERLEEWIESSKSLKRWRFGQFCRLEPVKVLPLEVMAPRTIPS